MARGTEEQKPAADLASDFPYQRFVDSAAWKAVDAALAELESNNDLELQTARCYVIGYLLQSLESRGLLPPAILQALTSKYVPHSNRDATVELLVAPGMIKPMPAKAHPRNGPSVRRPAALSVSATR